MKPGILFDPSGAPLTPSLGAPPVEDAMQAHAEALMAALVATGMTQGEALGQACATLGMDAAKPLFDEVLAAGIRSEAAIHILDDVAQADPAAANAWLSAALMDHRIKAWERDDTIGEEVALILEGRKWVTSLPDGLRVEGSLYVANTGITALPHGLWVREDLAASDCVELTTVPGDISVGISISLSGCTSLKEIGEGLQVGGALNLRHCTALESLPPNLEVSHLTLDWCASLRALPPGLKVCDIYMQKCSAWDGVIPADINRSGTIYTDAFPNGWPHDSDAL